jgi:hypothetical protein
LTFALALTGCAGGTSPHPNSNLGWNHPGMQLGGDRGLPLHNADGSCRKRGCDNGKLFFNPGQPEPSVNSIHRGW